MSQEIIIPDFVKGQIYRIDCEINNKVYIGQTKTHLFIGGKWQKYGYLKRWQAHKSCAESEDDKKWKKSIALYSAIRMHGIENFTINLEEGNIPLKELDDNERWYINFYESLAPGGYNLESGGNKGKILSEETKERQSETRKNFYQSDEGKAWTKKYLTEENPIKTRQTNDNKKLEQMKSLVFNHILVSECPEGYILNCRGPEFEGRKRFRFYDTTPKKAIDRVKFALKECNIDEKIINWQGNH
nr:GIY-YIG catalytic domain-containing endonuclease [Kaumoebavirus]